MKCLLGFHDWQRVSFRFGTWYECWRCGHRRENVELDESPLVRLLIFTFLALFVLYIVAHLVWAVWLKS